MLIVDLHTLEAVNLLDLTNQVIGQVFNALQPEDIVGIRLAVSDSLAANNLLALEHVEMTPLRNQLLVTLAVLFSKDQATLALGFLAEADRTRVLGHDRRILWLTRFEQVGHTRQTTGDIAGLGRRLWDARDDITH